MKPDLYQMVSLLLVGASGTAWSDSQEEKKPNILIAFADDWGRYSDAYSGLEGESPLHDLVKTPNFDRVARQGVLFNNAHVSAPSCTPSRSALLSGQYFWRTGRGAVLLGDDAWDFSIPSFPLMLRDQGGYHIGQTYKVWGPALPKDAPYDGTKHEYERHGTAFNTFSQDATRLMDVQGKSLEDARQVLYDEVLGNFEDFLDDRKPGQPLCYWWGPRNTHRSWTKGSGKRLWGIDPDQLKGKLPAFMPDVPDVREDFADYLGEICALDHGLGLLLNRLEEIGELDNTIVIVSGDHGPPGFPRGKANLYDFGTRVPLAIMWPKQIPPGRIVDDFVNLTDLAPTFLESAGMNIPDVMTGRSLMNVLLSKKSGWVDPSRDYVVTGRETHCNTYPSRAIRTKDWLYIYNFRPELWPAGNPVDIEGGTHPTYEQLETRTWPILIDMDASPTKAWLVTNQKNEECNGAYYYDLAFAKRPQEELYRIADDSCTITNLAANPEFQNVKAELKTRLMDELKRYADPRLTSDIFDKPPFAR